MKSTSERISAFIIISALVGFVVIVNYAGVLDDLLREAARLLRLVW